MTTATAAPGVDVAVGAPHDGAAPGRARHVVVVGYGMAAVRFVDEFMRAEHARAARPGADRPAARVSVVGAEPHHPYNRVLLSEVVAGRAAPDGLGIADLDQHRGWGVHARTATTAVRLDLPARLVHLHDGGTLAYDHLVLATGARARTPRLDGLDPRRPPRGVHALRTLDDAHALVHAAATARHAVVVGGGLLGLEAARGLARRGLAVTVLHSREHLLPGLLDPDGARVLRRALADLDVQVRTSTRPRALAVHDGAVTGVHLADPAADAPLPADLVVLACGVEPRVDLARDAGLAVARGVVVDDRLRTDDPAVSAIGDCAEHAGATPGLVAPAWAQATVVAALLSGADPAARYGGHEAPVRLKTADLDVLVAGDVRPDLHTTTPGVQVAQMSAPARGRHVKVVVRDGHVVGAAVVGDARACAELALLVERRAPAPADPTGLLVPGAAPADRGGDDPTRLPDRTVICRCNAVTKKQIVQAWTAGARDLDALRRATRACTGCGSCSDTVQGLASWLAAADDGPGPAAAPPSHRGRTPHRADRPAAPPAGGTA